MTKNTFRQYRVLGKGGFGEVSGLLVPLQSTLDGVLVALDLPASSKSMVGPHLFLSTLATGMCLPGAGDRQDVCVQETGKETNQEAERGGHGAQ